MFLRPTHGSVVASQVALEVKNLPANTGDIRDVGLIPGPGRSSGEENGSLFQYPLLKNPMDMGAWQASVKGSQRVSHD